MLKVAIIGAGDHSRIHHGSACARLEARIDRAAVCALDAGQAAAFAREFGFRRSYTDMDLMIDEVQPDVIEVITPVSVNYPIARKLIPRRIPLLLEKPPGETAAQASELLALAEACGTRVMVSFNRRFAPPLLRLREWRAARPDLLPPVLIRASMYRVARREPEFIMATAIHALDAILALMGEPVKVDVRPLRKARNGLTATMAFPGGGVGVFSLLPETGVNREEYELSGAGWQLRAEINSGAFDAWHDGRLVDRFLLDPAASETDRSGAAAENAYFIERAEHGLDFDPGLRHGVAVMRLAEILQGAVDDVGKGD